MKRHRTADLDPTSFGGRYTLLRRLAIGGMAEIYLARQAAMAGFDKEVVIKRLRAELADDPRIVEMFLDEARIGSQLNHPNIVHVYDVDVHDGIPYIAMEYIVGEELNELCRRGIAHDRFLPIEHAVELMRQAAAGMGYFHAKRGSEGTELAEQTLDIVHLDISPTNLLVTQDGFLKVIDFGIANAKGQSQRGDVIPGKLGYMSPEQAARKQVDHRSDIFSLGIVLYEVTVGRRLFRGAPQDIVPRLIEAQVEPPTFVRRNFPTALESIVMRALEKHAEDRYQSAYDLADDLETFLRDARLHSGPVRIARYIDMLNHAAGGARRPELVSEAEAAAFKGDDLDFDRQVFDSFAPSPGAPGPEQAPDWEDVDQPEAEIAQALGMELAELRALRTPVPAVPAGMARITGKQTAIAGLEPQDEDEATVTSRVPLTPPPDDDRADGTEPKRRAITDTGDEEPPTLDSGAPASAAQVPTPATTAAAMAAALANKLPAASSAANPASPIADSAWIGAPSRAILPPAPRSATLQHLPWILVGALGVAVATLVAYIVLA